MRLRQVVYLNGRFVPMADAVVPIEDRGYQFADGVYDVLKFHGRRPVRLTQHLERLTESCAGLHIEGIPSPAQWLEIINDLAERSGLAHEPTETSILYIQVTRGVAPRVHYFPEPQPTPTVLAYFKTAPVYPPELRERGAALISHPDERWGRCHIKSIALLPVVLAKQAAREAGALEALLVRDGVVTEGGASNAFCVRDGVVYTHPDGPRILSGVTRGIVLDAAQRLGIELRQEPVTLEEFRRADEAFLSSTTMNVMPVTRLDGSPIGHGAVGPITQALAQCVDQIIAEETGGKAGSVSL
ncbi:MAG: D-amino acid aminotransferase [Candidatus Sumerlaeaceae bacterium]|nr:D-amino acid aminotransferase [Candidatus Sumerlaeaceae bacterium]